MLILSHLANLREHGVDIGRLGDIGRVGFGASQEEVIPESVVARRCGDALVNGNLLRSRIVGDANVEEATLEILDAVGRVGRVPGYLEGLGAVGDLVVDVRICESYQEDGALDTQ